VRIAFPYETISPVEIPDARLLGVVGPQDREATVPEPRLIQEALAHPLGCLPLRDLARGRRRVLILFDDNTRPTPADRIVPYLLEAIGPDPEIRFLTASGTHRPMTAAEKEVKLGREICSRYPVLDHLWHAPAELRSLGSTPSGIPVEVNRLLLDSDLVLGVGHVAPHRIAGFGGGSKIVQPGVCGAATTGRTHWVAATFPGEEFLGVAENPVRAEMERVGAMAGLAAVVNVVLNRQSRMIGCFFGAPAAAYGAACALSGAVFRGPIPDLADVVVVESFPADLDLWQASKGLGAAELAVKPGGVVILVTPCPEGVSQSHPAMLEYGYQPVDRVTEWVARGELADLMVASELAIGGRVIRDRARGILVSPGISPEASRRLGFIPAAAPQEALEMAFTLVGAEATVLVLCHGGEILPTVAGRS
jgi:nickel-dependent lactate racemase